ncbi:MAG: FRG domain-containing protein [Rubrivivax sp.]|nr:FRG domain-containing protein [Rubrivivax sp.]
MNKYDNKAFSAERKKPRPLKSGGGDINRQPIRKMNHMADAITEITCSSAEDLLERLGRGNTLWEGTRQFWVFRGHSNDEKYRLIPTALRAKPPAILGYTFKPKAGLQATNAEQKNAELERLHEFYWSIDAQGLHVPGDSNLLRTPCGWRKMEETIQEKGWPIDELLPLLALAQHYEVPTRLLDWSDSPLVAAFFAAKGAASKEPKGKFLSVWALNLDWIIHEAFPGRVPKMSVYVVTAPRASNPNLHAQGGVFTTENLTGSELSAPVSVRTVDEIVKERWQTQKSPNSVMVHLKLPAEQSIHSDINTCGLCWLMLFLHHESTHYNRTGNYGARASR